MKRFTMIVALLLLMAMPMMAERVTPETACKVSATFLNNNGAKTAQLTDLSKEAGFPNLYIFNGNPGFVVMAADDCVQPILGYSLTGKFVAENMPTNVSGWLQGYNDEIQFAIDSKMSATAETAKMWRELAEGNSKTGKATTVVDPLLQTIWDQNGIYYYSGGQLLIYELYNNLCPYDSNAGERTVTGCVATAMAQIMKYWGYPAQGIGSHSYIPSTRPDLGEQSANFGATTYEWNNMPNELGFNSTTTEINAIATLMYHCGVSVDMMYNIGDNGGSSAYAEDIPNALITYFNYKSTTTHLNKSSYSNDNWITLLKTELDASRPVEYNGRGDLGGHAFVCDGYDSNNNFHFNWGWSGQNNGFFALTSLNPGSGGAGGGSYDFSNNQNAVIGIEPASTIGAPTNLTYTLSGTQNVTLNWGGVSGASSYKVFRNSNLIGNTASTTYSDLAPYGTTSYYVRSVDSNGQMSLASNTVTVTIDYPTPIVNDLAGTLSGNNVSLSWSAPEWCYPETPTATLTYGDGIPVNSFGTGGTGNEFYWGHRYLANELTAYNGKTIYKVSFNVDEPGAYECFLFKGTNVYQSSYYYPKEEIAHFTISSSMSGWIDLDFDETIDIDGSQDLWVFIYDPVGRAYPATYCEFSEHNNGGYCTRHYPIADVSGYLLSVQSGIAFLICTYVTDGTYTYNLYQDGSEIAHDLDQTNYNSTLNNNSANVFTVKTNYYDGETDNSNKIGFSKGNASLGTLNLAGNDLMTITFDSKLTVTSLSSASSGNLILENGAQLLNESGGVKATVKKDITAYTADDDGWYFIASPVIESITPSDDNGLLANDYDLYIFDQSQTSEWRNYEAGSFSTLYHKTGYLYANSGNTTLSFAGTLAASAEATSLAYNASATFKGFNLIGNPYPCNTTITNDFYIISGSTVTLAENGRAITPCEGVFVKATGGSQTVTFNKATSAKGAASTNCIDLVVSQGKATTDRARVRFGEGIGMEKFNLDEKHSQITLWQNGQDYAVAYTDGVSEMPISYAAAQDGTYTLSVENEGLDLNYLHLIDNMTGEDVDLLAMPSYTFEAKTNDYPSRFRLMFAPEEDGVSTSSATFAYYANGEIIITGVLDACNASLQIVDMMGHVITTCVGRMQCIPTSGMTPGVYVLRLIDGETIRTQKIVLR